MVVSKEGKRRRKVTAISQTGSGGTNPSSGGAAGPNGPISSTAAERDLSPPEIPKRPKVHAQRKFAQGQSTASSSYLSYSSAPPTPAKDGQNNRSSGSGAGNGNTAPTASGTGTGPESTPQVSELLPNMRPNTEDFLTFLCFRGTPVLPPALDFFNKSSSNAGNGTSGGGGSRQASTTSTGGAGTSSVKPSQSKTSETSGQSSTKAAHQAPKQTNAETKRDNGSSNEKLSPPVSSASEKPTIPVPATTTSTTTATTTYIPFAVRKRAEQVPAAAPVETRSDRRTQDKMQALRKKYHDQRVAKLRATTQSQRQSARTGSGSVSVSTRSSNVTAKLPPEEEEEDGSADEEMVEEKGTAANDTEEKGKRSNTVEESNVGRRKSGLRSGGAASHTSTSPVVGSVKTPPAKTAARGSTKRDSMKAGTAEQETSDAKTPVRGKTVSPPEQPLTEEESPRVGVTRGAGGAKKTAKEMMKNSPNQVGSDAEGKEKRTTRLSTLRNPPAPVATKTEQVEVAKSPKEQPVKNAKQKQPDRVDFSSDDDEPLSRTTRAEKRASESTVANAGGKTTRSGRATRKLEPIAPEKETDGTPVDKKARRSESVVSRRSDISSRKSEMRDVCAASAKKVAEQPKQQRGRKKKEIPTQSSTEDHRVNVEPCRSPDQTNSVDRKSQGSTTGGAAGRKKRDTTTPALPDDGSGANLASQSSPVMTEAEEKKPKTASSTPVESLSTSRPSRKTKEAATLYMELIGRKLNHDDKSDDDASSLDSLELPNVRRLERMENELKANAVKTRDAKQQPAAKGKRKGAAAMTAASAVETTEPAENTKQNEKSFSDSDEEPLASKFQRKKGGKQPTPGGKRKAAAKPAVGRRNGKKANAVDDGAKSAEETVSSPEKKLDTTKDGGVEQTPTSSPSRAASKKGATGTVGSSCAPINASPVTTKHNGTGLTTAAAKTPAKGSLNSPLQQSPAVSTSDHLKSPATSDGPNVSRFNKSLDNTQLSTTVEPAESPVKVPHSAMLNIPTVVTQTMQTSTPILAPQTTSPAQQAPFTRAIKPSGTPGPTAPAAAGAGQLNVPQPSELPFNRNVAGNATLPHDDADFLKGFLEKGSSPPEEGGKAHPTSSLLGNLLPSKEESEKIFGIASVSLAQSSGPLDTKCTLGKCGSVHKPPLGPPVLTESLLGGNLSPRDRRKAKVNMTHEQIQKWIYESSWSPIEDDLKDDDLELVEPTSTRTPPPPPPPPPSAAVQVASTAATAAAAATTATAVTTPTSLSVPNAMATTTTTPATGWAGMMAASSSTPLRKEEQTVSSTPPNAVPEKTTPKETLIVPSVPFEVKAAGEKESVPMKAAGEIPPAKESSTPTAKGKQTEQARKTKASEALATTRSPAAAVTNTTTTATTPTDRKPIYRNATGRTPVYKQQPEQTVKQPATSASSSTPVVTSPPSSSAPPPSAKQPSAGGAYANKFGAFSPDNEPSVYSFDKEEDFMPVATPFRRQRCNSAARDDPPPAPKRDPDEKFQKPPGKVKPAGLSVEDQQQQDCAERKDAMKQEVSESEPDCSGGGGGGGGQTFYIPLQGPTAGAASGGGSGGGGGGGGCGGGAGSAISVPSSAGKSADQLIQGVAVKLGTEGPDGPNQRVIMHAKLVTKAEMGSNPLSALPDTMNVQELVKSLTAQGGAAALAGKEALAKLLPIGTVQPRFKSAEPASTTDPPRTPTQEERGESRGGLSRIASNSSLSSQRSKPTGGGGGTRNVKGAASAKSETATSAAAAAAAAAAALPPAPQPDNNTVFPRRDDPAQMVEAPVFKPTEKEFHDPMEYIERIAPVASRFGICRIIPPASFKPECRIADDMRFMAYNQYVHKMLHRWGPSAKEYAAIKKYLATQSINLQSPPVIGGMEVDLPRLYHTVQELGGLKEVIEKKKWARVSEDMCIPKAAHDRVSKLDDIYCKYLLPYDTLSPAERQKLFDEVEADWAKREAKARRNADKGVGSEIRNSGDSDEDDDSGNSAEEDEEEEDECSMECIVKGRSMPLNQFFRIARNTMSLWFRNSEPTVGEIEAEYWRHVAVRDSHVCVHSGSIDSSAFGYGFPSPKVKGSSCAKHPWNLKVLTNNSGSILRSLGPVMGITIPTLHVGMLFSACCWYRDPHGLPWIEYLHTGANKIWYGVPDDQNANFRAALTVLVPTHCQNKTIWLPCDTAMVPPHMLTDRSVSLCRTEQQPGQFVVVFPRAYTSSLCTGYAVSESVYFATNSWLDTAKEDFRDIQESCEPTMFSVEQLLFAIANDQRSNHDTLVQAYPMIIDIFEKEKQHRQTLKEQGVTKSERIESKKKSASLDEFECERCRANLYLSLVKVKVTRADDDDDDDGDNTTVDEEERIYCLKHAVKHLADGGLQTKHCRLAYTYSLDDIEELLKKLQDRIANKKSSKSSAGSSGGGGGGGGGGVGGGGGGSGRGKSSLHLASTSSQSSSSYQAPSHSKYAGMATMLK
uniref:ARID domain-containing protein n=1 Tax=Anopheles farauti TaxID=69004 RepID=A0A182QF43_9DIPT